MKGSAPQNIGRGILGQLQIVGTSKQSQCANPTCSPMKDARSTDTQRVLWVLLHHGQGWLKPCKSIDLSTCSAAARTQKSMGHNSKYEKKNLHIEP
eukprot:754526-Amphidinium_carterae.1